MLLHAPYLIPLAQRANICIIVVHHTIATTRFGEIGLAAG